MLRAEELERRDTPTVGFVFDYSYDTNGFFNNAAARQSLELAGHAISSRLGDRFTAIVPSGGNTWTAAFFNTVTNQTVSLRNPVIAADEIRVYVAGGPLTSSELGVTSGGSYTASGSQQWLDNVRGRGQAGAVADPATDVATWGGFVAFDSTSNWNFGIGSPSRNQFDFASVASHELLHMLGFGLGGNSYTRYVSGSRFTGPTVAAIYGGPAPLQPGDTDHWAEGTTLNGATPVEVPSVAPGVQRSVTPLDFAVLADIGWQVAGLVPPVVPPPPTSPPGLGTPIRFAVGADAGSLSAVAGINGNGEFVYTHQPFSDEFTGGTRVASADFNRDGTPDLVVGSGPGAGSLVEILDGRTQAVLFSVEPFEASFIGGVYVAAGDLTGDGRPDLVIAPDEGGGPRVDVYSGNGFARTASFFGIDDPNFRGGARPAVGDINGDGRADLIVAAGFGGGPRVAGYSGTSIGAGRTPQKIFADFFAFEPALRNGIFVAVGDIDADGRADLIAGGGPGGGPRVSVFSGRQLTSNQYVMLANFFSGDVNSRGGVRVAVANLDGDTRADLVTGSGAESGSRLAGYSGLSLTSSADPAANFDFDFYPGFTGGLFVG